MPLNSFLKDAGLGAVTDNLKRRAEQFNVATARCSPYVGDLGDVWVRIAVLRLGGVAQSLAIVSDGTDQLVAAGCSSGVIHLLSPDDGSWVSSTHVPGHSAILAASEDRSRLCVIADRMLTIYAVDKRRLAQVASRERPTDLRAVSWHPSGERLAVSDWSGVVTVHASDDLRELEKHDPLSSGTHTCVSWSNDGEWLIVARNTAVLWLPRSFRAGARIQHARVSGDIEAMAQGSSGLLWCGCNMGDVVAFTDDGTQLTCKQRHSRRINALLVDSDEVAYSLSDDGRIRSWGVTRDSLKALNAVRLPPEEEQKKKRSKEQKALWCLTADWLSKDVFVVGTGTRGPFVLDTSGRAIELKCHDGHVIQARATGHEQFVTSSWDRSIVCADQNGTVHWRLSLAPEEGKGTVRAKDIWRLGLDDWDGRVSSFGTHPHVGRSLVAAATDLASLHLAVSPLAVSDPKWSTECARLLSRIRSKTTNRLVRQLERGYDWRCHAEVSRESLEEDAAGNRIVNDLRGPGSYLNWCRFALRTEVKEALRHGNAYVDEQDVLNRNSTLLSHLTLLASGRHREDKQIAEGLLVPDVEAHDVDDSIALASSFIDQIEATVLKQGPRVFIRRWLGRWLVSQDGASSNPHPLGDLSLRVGLHAVARWGYRDAWLMEYVVRARRVMQVALPRQSSEPNQVPVDWPRNPNRKANQDAPNKANRQTLASQVGDVLELNANVVLPWLTFEGNATNKYLWNASLHATFVVAYLLGENVNRTEHLSSTLQSEAAEQTEEIRAAASSLLESVQDFEPEQDLPALCVALARIAVLPDRFGEAEYELLKGALNGFACSRDLEELTDVVRP